MSKIIENDKKYIANTYARCNIVIKSGKGSYVYDENGKEYIDLGSGIAVNTFGISDNEWINAITAQASVIQHSSNLYYTEPQVKLAEMLCEKTGMSKVFFSNSGAEANECAIKTARKYSNDKYKNGRNKIITLKNSFHGRTVTTLSATGQDCFHADEFAPYTDGFLYAEANNLENTLSLMEDKSVCAIMAEMIQGEGGVNVLEQEYISAIVEYAHKHDILVICDEVQTGNGRTGKLYSYMHYGFTPDIVSTAKGLAGGLPLGATLFNETTANVLTAGKHGSTFGGNPVCASGALSILSRLDESFLDEVSKKGDYIRSSLENAKGVKSISGMGLMVGIETEKDVKEVFKNCFDNGLIVLTAKNKIRLLPALNIEKETLDKAINIIKKSL